MNSRKKKTTVRNPAHTAQVIEFNRQEAVRKNAIAKTAAATADTATLTTIFVLLAKETLKIAFEQLAKYILLPVAVLAQTLQMAFAWRHAKLNKFKGRSLVTALVETAATALIATAVIGGLVLQTAFSVVAPLLFAITFAGKTLYNFASSIYYGISSVRESDPYEKERKVKIAKECMIGGVVGAIATVAVVGVMLLGKTAMAVLGIIAGVLGTIFGIAKAVELANKNSDRPSAPPYMRVDDENDSDNDNDNDVDLSKSQTVRREEHILKELGTTASLSRSLSDTNEDQNSNNVDDTEALDNPGVTQDDTPVDPNKTDAKTPPRNDNLSLADRMFSIPEDVQSKLGAPLQPTPRNNNNGIKP